MTLNSSFYNDIDGLNECPEYLQWRWLLQENTKINSKNQLKRKCTNKIRYKLSICTSTMVPNHSQCHYQPNTCQYCNINKMEIFLVR